MFTRSRKEMGFKRWTPLPQNYHTTLCFSSLWIQKHLQSPY